ncbi:MAG: CPBP family intramembrane metalloprotease [Anaerolineaceae bacterium]|nr:CPBP family intramembrane metalloprotease [Anaerolineaceae bacterium]
MGVKLERRQFHSDWRFVAFAEEIAFRGYLHNKLVAVVGRRWLAILLAALAFGLWHTPADIAGSGQVLSPFLNALLFALVGLVFFHLPYEWTGLLPFLALFHGWNDFLLLPTLEAPTAVGAAAGYVLMWVVLWAGWRFSRRHAAAARAGSQAGM